METKSNKLLAKYKKIGKNKNQMKKTKDIINSFDSSCRLHHTGVLQLKLKILINIDD